MHNTYSHKPGAIGIFDSGYGGLTVMAEIIKQMPEYDYIYLGDNARTPYGNRSFDLVYAFTLQAIKWFFAHGCHLVILACNTASAKALRSIQQNDLPKLDASRRVLGVIRPTTENCASFTRNRHIGILGTEGTIKSRSYEIEIKKLHSDLHITGEACPMWVPLVENKEHDKAGADYFVKQHIDRILEKDPMIDALILGCTHYPLLQKKITQFAPQNMRIISQGKYVAESLKDYLHRHPEMDENCTKNGTHQFFTTDSVEKFTEMAALFLQKKVEVTHTTIESR